LGGRGQTDDVLIWGGLSDKRGKKTRNRKPEGCAELAGVSRGHSTQAVAIACGRAEPKGEKKPMRSHEEQRQQNISQESLRQREAVKPSGYAGAPSSSSAQIAPSSREGQNGLLEKMLEGENLRLAYKRVVQNRGAPGVDGVTVAELQAYLKTHWETVKGELLAGTYRPAPVKRVEIPKPGGGVRLLGIPTVMDRFLQQALLQVMNPMFDAHFSWYSYGFRPGKSAHDGVKQAQRYIQSGSSRGRNAGKGSRRHSTRGSFESATGKHPADDLDKELTGRGLRFVRYADDCNIFVASKRAGERVMESVNRFVEGKLKLKVNREKSAVARPWKRTFLGFSLLTNKAATLRLAPKTISRFKERIRELTNRTWSISIEEQITRINRFVMGWMGYVRLASAKTHCEALDKWIRRRLRMCLWKQWKCVRTRIRELRALGVPEWAVFVMANSMARRMGNVPKHE
jgi:hypothetical protein